MNRLSQLQPIEINVQIKQIIKNYIYVNRYPNVLSKMYKSILKNVYLANHGRFK